MCRHRVFSTVDRGGPCRRTAAASHAAAENLERSHPPLLTFPSNPSPAFSLRRPAFPARTICKPDLCRPWPCNAAGGRQHGR